MHCTSDEFLAILESLSACVPMFVGTKRRREA
jgi:hypothetical protein